VDNYQDVIGTGTGRIAMNWSLRGSSLLLGEGRRTLGRRPVAFHGICSGIGCRTPLPIPVLADWLIQQEATESHGEQRATPGLVATEIGCTSPLHLPEYADQSIQLPNSSYADRRR
jgi:hypothetical protein